MSFLRFSRAAAGRYRAFQWRMPPDEHGDAFEDDVLPQTLT
jgi:hypothetical protein